MSKIGLGTGNLIGSADLSLTDRTTGSGAVTVITIPTVPVLGTRVQTLATGHGSGGRVAIIT